MAFKEDLFTMINGILDAPEPGVNEQTRAQGRRINLQRFLGGRRRLRPEAVQPVDISPRPPQ